MALLAVSIITRSGSIIVSRQYLPLTRTRLESLLSQFPRLLRGNQQHTFVETDEVRFLYQPLEGHFLVLLTSRGSNLLQDIDTLRLLSRLMTEQIPRLGDDESVLKEKSVELLLAFDEVVTLGYREKVGMSDLNTILAMESQEEIIQEIIAKNKMQEAKEAAKRKIKQMEMEKKEAARKSAAKAAGYPGAGLYSPIGNENDTGGLISSPSSGFSSSITSNLATSHSQAPPTVHTTAGLGKGMKLGRRINTDL